MHKIVAIGALSLALAAFTAGCGSDDDSGSGTSASTSAETTQAAGGSLQETAKQKVVEYSAAPTDFPGPTEPFDPGTGTAEAVACGFSAPVCADQAKYAVEAIKAMGWTAPPALDGAFSPQKQAAFVDQAVQKKLDGMILVSIDLESISAAVDRAAKAGVTITCTMCATDYSKHPDWKGKVFDVTIDWKKQGEMNAWFAMSQNGDKTKVVSFQDKAYPSTKLRADGYEATIKANCPSCTFERKDFATANIAKPGPPEFTALLSTKPEGSMTNVVAHYDGLGVAMAKTAKQQGRTDFAISGYDASTDGVTAIVKGDPPYAATVGEAYTYAEWVAADIIARVKAGAPIWPGYDSLPVVLVTSENAEKYVNSDPVPAGDWKATWAKNWNKG